MTYYLSRHILYTLPHLVFSASWVLIQTYMSQCTNTSIHRPYKYMLRAGIEPAARSGANRIVTAPTVLSINCTGKKFIEALDGYRCIYIEVCDDV